MNALIGILISIILFMSHMLGGSSAAQQVRQSLQRLTQRAAQIQPLIATTQVRSVPATSATSVVLALNISQSMAGPALAGEKAAAKTWLGRVPAGVPVALVTFNGQARLSQGFTTDHRALAVLIDGLTASGLRDVYDAGQLAVQQAASASTAHKVVILLNDGWQFSNSAKVNRQDALTAARDQGVTVYTVGLGGTVDKSYLTELASRTNGHYFAATTPGALTDIFTTLAVQIATGTAPEITAAAGQTNQTVKVPAAGLMTVKLTTKTTAKTPVPSQAGITTALNTQGAQPSIAASVVTYGPLVVNGVRRSADPTSAVVLALDGSASMSGTALQREKDAAKLFIQSVDGTTPVSVVVYNAQSKTVQDFTLDKAALVKAIDGIKATGATALYDGSLAAVKQALMATVTNRSVLFFNGSPETAKLSKAKRQDALDLAVAQNITVFTLQYGPKADKVYLADLARATNALSYNTPTATDLAALYTALGGPFTAQVKAPAGSANIVPLDSSLPPVINSQGQPVNTSNVVIGNPGANTLSTGSTGAGNPAVQPAATTPNTAPIPVIDTPAADTTTALNVAPISITLPADMTIESAELALNDHVLATFTEAPYKYDLDLMSLTAGQYRLAFSVVNSQGVVSKGTLDFEVAVVNPTSSTTNTNPPAVDPTAAETTDTPDIAQDLPAQARKLNGSNAPKVIRPVVATILDTAARVVLIDSKPAALTLTFSLDKGLMPIAAVTTTPKDSGSVAGDTVMQILARPATLIPAPIRAALMAQHPRFWALVILLMTIILLPQGLFTLYWMMYTWNNPDVAEQYRSPKEFTTPTHSFTAILPARHEEKVIRDTIMAVDAIRYPDELKEILIMIRDEDDDATIQAAQNTINELGKDNIKLVTFTTGPKNKPNGLNRGLKVASKEVICVFDAEDQPHPDIYNVVNTVMVRDNADVVQSGVQLMNFTSNWFSALNCLEYFFWFKSGLHAFTRSLKVTPLGGNTVFLKKHWLDEIGGWDEKCLTEDADIGIRLTAKGAKIQIVYDEQHATQEETPDTANSFIKQRTRWCQGFYEIFFKGDWLKLPLLKQKITAIYILLNSLLQAMVVLFLPVGLYIGLTQRMAVPVAMLSWTPMFLLFIQLVTNLIGIREFATAYHKKMPFLFTLRMIVAYYPYQLMLAVSALRAIQRFVSRKNAWEKTAHSNLHRQAQPAAQKA